MKIVKLEAQNVKRLNAVEITPDGDMVVIGGRNGAGKTSVLDSIAYALGGKALVCDKPVRTGTKKAKIVCDLGELTVTRTFTARGGGTLAVTGTDGAKLPTPQAVLDALTGKLTFDPLAFTRQAPRQQAETLRELVGLDFTDLDARREGLFENRTGVRRDIRALESQLEAVPHHDDAPAEEVDARALLDEYWEAKAHNDANDGARADLKAAQAEIDREAAMIASAEAQERGQLEDLRRQIGELQRREQELTAAIAARTEQRNEGLGAHRQRIAELEPQVADLEDIDLKPLHQAHMSADGVNRKVRENQAHAKLATRLGQVQTEADGLTAAIDAFDEQKAAALREAEFPIQGLGFNDERVTFKDLPFENCSSAEKLRISVAMGLAMNPKLKILLIRDGSLLDADSLRLVAEMAEAHDAQIWIERVGQGKECSVIIENGAVKGATLADTPIAEHIEADAEGK